MPWCEDCARFWNPNTVPPDGTCPTCGRLIAEPVKAQKIPWHFWVLLVAGGIYLTWRAIQGVAWLLAR